MNLPTTPQAALRLAASLLAASPAIAVTSAEVTFVSPNYIATKKVNGIAVAQVYRGIDYPDAVNAAINNLTPNRTAKETVEVLAGGNSGNASQPYDSAIVLKPYTVLDFNNNTLHVNPVGSNYFYKVGIRADRTNHVEIRNVRITGWPIYGIWVRSSDNVTLSGVNMAFSINPALGVHRNGLGIRADDSARTPKPYLRGFRHEGTSTFSGTKGAHGANHGIETDYLDWAVFGNVTGTDIDGCALLLQHTRNTRVGVVTGVRADKTFGSYAAFRCANSAGPNIVVEKVISRESGRGFFTTTDSEGITVRSVDLRESVSEGILLQTGSSANVGTIGVASYIMDGGAEGIRTDLFHTGSTFNQIALRRNADGGIWETNGAGGNAYVNVDARNGVGVNTRLGPGSTFTGGFR